MALLGYSKRIVYIVAEEGRKKGILCPQCGNDNITAELCFGRFRIQECRDCGYSSDKFMELRKMKPNA
jgi:uncharacterized Zn finger protein